MIRTEKCLLLMLQKNLNVKVFNLMSRTNETRRIRWHETCKCKCRLDASLCNNKQRWNDDKCWCECKELIDKCVHLFFIQTINKLNNHPENLEFVKQFLNNLPRRTRDEN